MVLIQEGIQSIKVSHIALLLPGLDWQTLPKPGHFQTGRSWFVEGNMEKSNWFGRIWGGEVKFITILIFSHAFANKAWQMKSPLMLHVLITP